MNLGILLYLEMFFNLELCKDLLKTTFPISQIKKHRMRKVRLITHPVTKLDFTQINRRVPSPSAEQISLNFC